MFYLMASWIKSLLYLFIYLFFLNIVLIRNIQIDR